MKILGIDPATSCGWTILEDGRYVAGGAHQSKFPTPAQQKKGVPRGKKWLDFHEWLSGLLTEHRPDAVVAEDVRRHVSTLAGHAYGYFRYTIEALCAKNGIPFYPIGVTEWKSVSASTGSAKKETVAERMLELFPDVEFVTDDHSDSLGIAYAGYVYNTREGGLQKLLESAGGKRKKKKEKAEEPADPVRARALAEALGNRLRRRPKTD